MFQTTRTKKYYQFLYYIYCNTQGYVNRIIWRDAIAKDFSFDDPLIQKAMIYLINEKLFSSKSIGGINITYRGIDEIEDSIEHPECRTIHFPEYSIDYIEPTNRTINISGVKEIRDKRFQFLKKAYNMIENNGKQFVNLFEVSESIKLDRSDEDILSKKIYEYLESKGLIKSIFNGGSFTVTHLGIRQIESPNLNQSIDSKIAELIEAIDQLNTISKSKLGCRLFVGNSKTLLYLRKLPRNEGDFVLTIARIANIIEDVYLDEIRSQLNTMPNPGSVNQIKELLKSRNIQYDENALSNLRKLYKLRSTKSPIHSAEHEAVKILNEFGIHYPIVNYKNAAEILIDKLMFSIGSISSSITELNG